MKQVCVAFLIILVLLLSGCTSINKGLEKAIHSNVSFENDPDFQVYQQLSENGRLNSDSIYIEADSITAAPSSFADRGQIHVTFASNGFLKIRYYADAELKKLINQKECFLNPGDTIFATVESRNTISNLYGIARYLIIEYDAEGNIKAQFSQEADSNEVFSIPTDFSGNDLSIIPIGAYPDRKLSMRAFYIDDKNQEIDLANAGRWSINDEPCSGNQAAISPIVPYALRFDFDTKNYFFVSSTPGSFTADPDRTGFVEFWEADPTDDDIAYSVQLHRYLHLDITMEEAATVVLNDGEPETIKKNKTWTSDTLRYGDVITIETARGCTLSSGDFGHVHAARDPISGGYRYTLTIIQDIDSGAADILHVNEYISLTLPPTGRHGTCTYKLDGKIVSGTITLQLSQKLEATYTITDSSYRFGNISILGTVTNWFEDVFGNMSQTTTIQLTPEMNNTSLKTDEWFAVVKKGA